MRSHSGGSIDWCGVCGAAVGLVGGIGRYCASAKSIRSRGCMLALRRIARGLNPPGNEFMYVSALHAAELATVLFMEGLD